MIPQNREENTEKNDVAEEFDATAIPSDDAIGDGEIRTKSKISADIFDFLEMLAVAACAIVLLFSFVARLSSVEGTSMVGTLDDGDKLVVSNLFYEPERGDIIVFQDVDNQYHKSAIVKRVIAVGGQTVTLRYTPSGALNTLTVLVDGVAIDEPYRYYDPLQFKPQAHSGEYSYTVPEGHLFVMGDNTYISDDSRGSFGFVDEDKVLGRVVLRLCGDNLSSLFTKFGSVE